jgi:hypothetical protein
MVFSKLASGKVVFILTLSLYRTVQRKAMNQNGKGYSSQAVM